jgi:predicted alpha/beta hydrolase family esterase
MTPPILFIPGWASSGPGHWQTLWEARLRGARRVEMPDWLRPEPTAWVRALDHAIAATPAPPVLVAHSLGCIAIAHWAATWRRPVAAALLVAPADVEREACPAALRAWAPIPAARLPFPTTLVAADDDPYVALDRARGFADAWGSRFELVENGRHLNVASGHGEWPRGAALLDDLLARHGVVAEDRAAG